MSQSPIEKAAEAYGLEECGAPWAGRSALARGCDTRSAERIIRAYLEACAEDEAAIGRCARRMRHTRLVRRGYTPDDALGIVEADPLPTKDEHDSARAAILALVPGRVE